jgi:Flp pilus assembly secretin CpaC
MRALSVVSNVIFIFSCAITVQAQPPAAPNAAQVTGCPTVLPVAEGERSIVVPTVAPNAVAPHVEPLAQQPPHIASRPQSPQHEAAKTLLREKLAQRDQLQREIAALRESTQTPEQFSVEVKMIEINRTKLRKLGVDWSTFKNGQPTQTDLAALLGAKPAAASTTAPGVSLTANVDPAVLDVIAALERGNVSRVLASPTIVVMSGQPGTLHVGSEIAVPSPDSPGGVRTQKSGTEVDLTAEAVGDNRVRIRVRPRVSEPVVSSVVNQNGETMPALSVRQLDTAFEAEFGKTTILSGLVQERTETTINSLGGRSDEKQEIALMLIVTPQIVR